MGNTFRKMFDSLFGSREMRVVMLGEKKGSCLRWRAAGGPCGASLGL
jgi:hypothetical protein